MCCRAMTWHLIFYFHQLVNSIRRELPAKYCFHPGPTSFPIDFRSHSDFPDNLPMNFQRRMTSLNMQTLQLQTIRTRIHSRCHGSNYSFLNRLRNRVHKNWYRLVALPAHRLPLHANGDDAGFHPAPVASTAADY